MVLTFFCIYSKVSDVSDNPKQAIIDLVEPILKETELFLVEVEIKGSGKQRTVHVYVDSDNRGVNIDECAKVSRELGFLLDAHEVFQDAYRLEVSSPGLSRPLVDRRQYPKNVGRKSKIKFKEGEEYHKVEGTLQKLEGDHLMLETEEGESKTIEFEQIVETKIIPDI